MQFYKFPYINHINDVLPIINGKDEFIVIKKDGYQVIDYVYTTNDTFPDICSEIDITNSILRECRGLLFDEEGKLIARRLHKFFNVGERLETLPENIKFNPAEWTVMEKLDGSMITPFIVNKTMHWGTKKGDTEVSEPVYKFIYDEEHKDGAQYDAFAWWCHENGNTPIFEWCSRKQRIVVDHPVDRLVLIAIRDTKSGTYANYETMCKIIRPFGIEVIRDFDSSIKNLKEFVDIAKQHKDVEGYVLRHKSGHMLKCKADWYVNIHQTKDLIASEMKVCNLVLEGVVDDVLPLLTMDIDKERVKRYQNDFYSAILSAVQNFEIHRKEIKRKFSRKEYALASIYSDSIIRSLMFECWDVDVECEIFNIFKKRIKTCLTSAKKFATIKESLEINVEYGYEEVE